MSNTTRIAKNKEISPQSIKKNYCLTMIRSVLSFLVPLVTFPYVSRVLEPSGIGKVEFVNSIVAYFTLFAALGIPSYGMREIAIVRDNQKERSKLFWELFLILFIMTFFCYVIYFLCLEFVPFFIEYKKLFLITFPTLLLTTFSFEWFYQGIENQKLITQRFILVKIIQTTLIFLLIKNFNDVFKYALIIVTMSGFSSIFNVAYLHKYIDFVPFKELEIKKHLKPIFVIFASIVAVNIYTHLDVTMVGIYRTEEEVGFYTTANKLVRLIISFIVPLSTVLLPRLSRLKNEKNFEEYNHLMVSSLNMLLMMGIPILVGIEILAKPIIILFAGEKFLSSIFTLRLLSPIILIVSMAQFVGIQILYTSKKEKYYTISVSVAGFINFFLNIFAIQKWGHNGAVLGTLGAETIGLILQIIFARKELKSLSFSFKNFTKIIISSIFMGIVVFLLQNCGSGVLSLFLSVIVGAICYGGILILLKEETALVWLKKIFNRFRGER